jgi:5-formyltetrahydrofolate cyclo-ligase
MNWSIRKAVSISDALRFSGKTSLPKLPNIDLMVAGSVAVSLKGGRIGKSEGYSELEYGILRERRLINDHVRIVTAVHGCKIVEDFRVERFDIPVDYILIPKRFIETDSIIPKPRGIYWELVTKEMLRTMPILSELRENQPKYDSRVVVNLGAPVAIREIAFLTRSSEKSRSPQRKATISFSSGLGHFK